MAEILIEAEDAVREFSSSRGTSGPFFFETRKFLAYVAEAIASHGGWVSKTNANILHKMPTSDVAYMAMCPNPTTLKEDRFEPSQASIEQANAAIDWVRSMGEPAPEKGEYWWNLFVAVSGELLNSRSLGLAASAVAMYIREVEKRALFEKQQKLGAASNHFGEEKKRYDLNVRILSVRVFDGTFGNTYLVKMIDESGNLFSTFASRRPTWKSEPSGSPDADVLGTEGTIRATVKKHAEFKGVKETQLTRVEFLVKKAETTTEV